MKRFLIIAACLFSSSAWALDYRTVELADGRSFIAEVTGEIEGGLALTVPAGQIEVKHAQVIQMQPSDAEAYMLQGDWVVYVANGPDRRNLQKAYAAMPGVAVLDGNPEGPTHFDLKTLQAAEACGSDMRCLIMETEKAPWVWLVVAEKRDGKTVGLKGRLNTEHIVFIGSYNKKSSDERSAAIKKAIGVQ